MSRRRDLLASLKRLKGVLHKLRYGSAEELLELPGLGLRKVDRLLRERERLGESLGAGELLSIPGLGPRLLAGMGEELDPALPTLLKFIVYYQELVQGTKKAWCPSDVVSVDLGLHNSAWAHLDADLNVCRWKKLSQRMPKPYSPEKCYKEVLKSLEELPRADAYIIEIVSQRTALPNKGGFLDISVQLKSIEAMYYSVLRSHKTVPVLTILPRMTSQYFGICSKKSHAKKRAAVKLVEELITGSCNHRDDDCTLTPLGNKVGFSEEAVRYFSDERKKDDLCDSLLQAVAFMEWSRMDRELRF